MHVQHGAPCGLHLALAPLHPIPFLHPPCKPHTPPLQPSYPPPPTHLDELRQLQLLKGNVGWVRHVGQLLVQGILQVGVALGSSTGSLQGLNLQSGGGGHTEMQG
jgi:hypothetical protein